MNNNRTQVHCERRLNNVQTDPNNGKHMLAEIHLSDMGCLCSVVCFCFGLWLEDVLLSQLPGKLDALPSGKQLQMYWILLEEFPLHIWAQAPHESVQHFFVSYRWYFCATAFECINVTSDAGLLSHAC